MAVASAAPVSASAGASVPPQKNKSNNKKRGRVPKYPEDQIWSLLETGHSTQDVADLIGCSLAVVYYIKAKHRTKREKGKYSKKVKLDVLALGIAKAKEFAATKVPHYRPLCPWCGAEFSIENPNVKLATGEIICNGCNMGRLQHRIELLNNNLRRERQDTSYSANAYGT
jgi:hypothetical protein